MFDCREFFRVRRVDGPGPAKMSFPSLERSSKLIGASRRSKQIGGGGVGNFDGLAVGICKGVSLMVGIVKGVGSMADGEL